MRIYVASSWRNTEQPEVVRRLCVAGHDVYDFRHPLLGNNGFAWGEIDPEWQHWTARQQIEAYKHPVAIRGLNLDFTAMVRCEAMVMLQPSGRSAALELGWAIGAGKMTVVLMAEGQEPELMLRLADHLCLTLDEVVEVLGQGVICLLCQHPAHYGSDCALLPHPAAAQSPCPCSGGPSVDESGR